MTQQSRRGVASRATPRERGGKPSAPGGPPPRIEHIETIDPEDVPRFGKLGVIASMQPVHATPSPTPGDVWSVNIGEERAAHGWMWASIAKAGGRLAFGSDWPVMTLNPLEGMRVAVTRTTARGCPPSVGSFRASRLRKPLMPIPGGAWASCDEQRKARSPGHARPHRRPPDDIFSGQPPPDDHEVAVTIGTERRIRRESA